MLGMLDPQEIGAAGLPLPARGLVRRGLHPETGLWKSFHCRVGRRGLQEFL